MLGLGQGSQEPEACRCVPDMGKSGEAAADSCTDITAMEEKKQSAYSTQPETQGQHSPPHPSSLSLPQRIGIRKGAANQTCVNVTPSPSVCSLSQNLFQFTALEQ